MPGRWALKGSLFRPPSVSAWPHAAPPPLLPTCLLQTANGGDIRLILGQLQMIRLRQRALSYDQARLGGCLGGEPQHAWDAAASAGSCCLGQAAPCSPLTADLMTH